jgi:hypothetical protein
MKEKVKMVSNEYSDFEPKTKIPAEEFIARMRERRINLTEQDCRSVEHALKEYERFSFLIKIGEGHQLAPKLRKLEDAVTCLTRSIEAVREEEGYIWEDLVFKSGARIDGLGQLLEQCRKLNGEIPKRSKAQIKAFFLNRFLNKLANIYTAATGNRATISKSGGVRYPGGRGGRFAQFARAALKYLPDDSRPAEKTISGIGSRFLRMADDRKAGKVIPPNWIGLPYSPLAKPNWKQNQLRRLTGKRP